GITPGARVNIDSIFDDKGKLYIWGGNSRGVTDQAMYIFDTFDSTWSRILPSYVPEQRMAYSVTFKDGKIYFIGSTFSNIQDQKCVDIREIWIYDTLNTNNNPWTKKNAINTTYISNRYAHAAALAPSNQSIILYGGIISNASGIPPDYLITLDLQTFELSKLVTKHEPNIEDVS
ncbi:9362_t:CDS:2, partial [Ambispora gerdemannii]